MGELCVCARAHACVRACVGEHTRAHAHACANLCIYLCVIRGQQGDLVLFIHHVCLGLQAWQLTPLPTSCFSSSTHSEKAWCLSTFLCPDLLVLLALTSDLIIENPDPVSGVRLEVPGG